MACHPYFRQLLDAPSGTFTYLVADASTSRAVLIDPVLREVPLYLRLLGERSLHLDWVVDSHLHDDHVTGAWALCSRTSARRAAGRETGIEAADLFLGDGDTVAFGDERLEAIATPGHTRGCLSFVWRDRVFTGDSLLIGGCGRADPPEGNAGRLYDSLTQRLLTLPDETLVCPGHGEGGRRVSCIGDERCGNASLAGVTRDEFIAARAAAAPAPAARDSILALNRQGGDPDALGIPVPGREPRPHSPHH
jgi:glyoxylase-like metal-dependent hydrolase (beta-lactamase superfamily II)